MIMRKEQAIANMIVAEEVAGLNLELTNTLGELEEGFLKGITGGEVANKLIKALRVTLKIAKSSQKTFVKKDNENDETGNIDVNVIDGKKIAIMSIKIIGFLESLKNTSESQTEDELTEYIEDFFKEMSVSLLDINNDLSIIFNESKMVAQKR